MLQGASPESWFDHAAGNTPATPPQACSCHSQPNEIMAYFFLFGLLVLCGLSLAWELPEHGLLFHVVAARSLAPGTVPGLRHVQHFSRGASQRRKRGQLRTFVVQLI